MKLFADYGDGVLHEMVWSVFRGRNVAACGVHPGVALHIFLESQLPLDPDLCAYCTAGHRAPAAVSRQGRVDNAPLREAFDASSIKAGPLADAAGYMTAKKKDGQIIGMKPDADKVRRLLGIALTGRNPSTGEITYMRFIPREDALRLADALGLDPVEIGL